MSGICGSRGGFAGTWKGWGSLRGGRMKPIAVPSPLGAQPSRFLVARGFFSPFSLPSPDVRMFIKLRINLRPGDVQPGKHCADRVKGPSPARIIHPDVLIQAVRTNTCTSAQGGAGSASQKTRLKRFTDPAQRAGERPHRSTRVGRCPRPPAAPRAGGLDPAQRWERCSCRRPRAPWLARRQI